MQNTARRTVRLLCHVEPSGHDVAMLQFDNKQNETQDNKQTTTPSTEENFRTNAAVQIQTNGKVRVLSGNSRFMRSVTI